MDPTVLTKLAYILLLVRWTQCDSVTLGLLIPLTGSDPIGKRSAGALKVAMDDINGDDAFTELKSRNLTLQFVMVDTACSAGVGLINMVKIQDQVDAYIGGYCDDFCPAASMVAEQMTKSIISYGCVSIELSDKQRFPTFVRTVPPQSKVAPVLVALLRHYNWTRLVIIHGPEHVWHLTSASVKNVFAQTYKAAQITRSQQIDTEQGPTSVTPETALRRSRDISRVFVVLAYPMLVNRFMEASSKLKMQNGEYVFISVESDLASMMGTSQVATSRSPDHSSHSIGPNRDVTKSRVRRDSELTTIGIIGNMTFDHFNGNESGQGNITSSKMSMLDVNHNQSDYLIGLIDISAMAADDSYEYTSFASQVQSALMMPPFSSHLKSPDQVSLSTSVYLYDAVYLYAVALNKTLSHGSKLTNVIHNIFNIEFQGRMGPVVIDQFGDPLPHYTIRNYQDGGYVTVGSYQARVERILLDTDKTLLWPGGSTAVPIGRPLCGWEGEICIESRISQIVWSCLILGVVLIICLLAYLIYRYKHRESRLTCMQWKINYEEVKFMPCVTSSLSLNSITTKVTLPITHCQSSYSSRHAYTSYMGRTAIVRGRSVYIKSINKSHVPLTKSIIREMNEYSPADSQTLTTIELENIAPADSQTLTTIELENISLPDINLNMTTNATTYDNIVEDSKISLFNLIVIAIVLCLIILLGVVGFIRRRRLIKYITQQCHQTPSTRHCEFSALNTTDTTIMADGDDDADNDDDETMKVETEVVLDDGFTAVELHGMETRAAARRRLDETLV